jgi:2-keto-4-pentenoate hydratase/2-oxohepta-3-ene-1,7-dioic acid hydratase in catechol pathway
MKLIRFGPPEQEKPGLILPNGDWIDASAAAADYKEAFFADNGLERLAHWVNAHGASAPRIPSGTRLGSCVARPSKIICIGLNFSDHARETKAQIPTEPIIFFKSTTALTGPNDDLVIPKGSQKTDWEVELAVVIGRKASHVSEGEALNHVAGYALHNDYSEREFQLEHGGQWVKGKSCDTFAPLGPFLATPDEVANVHQLRMWLTVNGEIKQDGNTANMIFQIPFLISYLSRFMTLLPGDVISTGTPAGVGLGFNPPQYLRAGDVVALGIEGLGTSSQKAVAFGASVAD